MRGETVTAKGVIVEGAVSQATPREWIDCKETAVLMNVSTVSVRRWKDSVLKGTWTRASGQRSVLLFSRTLVLKRLEKLARDGRGREDGRYRL